MLHLFMFYRWFSSQPMNKLLTLPLNKKKAFSPPSLSNRYANYQFIICELWIHPSLSILKTRLGPLKYFLPASVILIFISRGRRRDTVRGVLFAGSNVLIPQTPALPWFFHHPAPTKWLLQNSAPSASRSYGMTAAPTLWQTSSAPASWTARRLAAASKFSQHPNAVLQWSASHRTNLYENP